MERTKKKYKYHVIQFIELPYSDIDDHVCVPCSWVRIRRDTDRKVIVSYPVEQPSQTTKRVKKRQKYLDDWLLYMATVKYDTDYYDDAELYITLVATNTRNNYGWRINKQGCSGVTSEGDKLLERKTRSSKRNSLSNPYVKILKISEEPLNINLETEIEKGSSTPPLPKVKIEIHEKKKSSQVSQVVPSKNEEPNHASKSTPPPPAPVCEDYSDEESCTHEISVDRSNVMNCMGQSGDSESSTQNRPSVIQSSPNLGNQRTMTEQNFFTELSALCKEMHAHFSDTCTMFDHLRTSFMHTAEKFKQVMEVVNEFCYPQSSPAIESTLNEATDKVKKNTEEIQNRCEERKIYDIDDDVNDASKRKRGRPHTVTGAVNGDCDSQYSTNFASIPEQIKAQFKNITDQEPRRDRIEERDKYNVNDNEVPKNNRNTPRRVIEAVNDYCDLQHKAASASSSEDARARIQKFTEDKEKDRETYDIDGDDEDNQVPKKRGRPHTVMGAVNDHCDSRYNAAIASTPKGATTKAPQIIEEKQKESETYDIDDDDKDIEGPKKKRGRPRTVMGAVNDHCDSRYNVAIASTSKGATTKAPQIIEEKQKESETYDIDGDDEDNQAPKKRGRPHTVMGAVNDHCDSRYNVAIASTSKGATIKAQQIIEVKQKERKTYNIDDDDKDIEGPKKKRGRPCTAMGTLNDYYATQQNVATASTTKGAITKAQKKTEEEQKRDRGEKGQTYYIDDDDKDIEAPKKKRGRQRTVMATVNDHCDSRYNVAIASTPKGATTKAPQIIEEKQKESETYDIDGDDEDNQAPKKRGRPRTVMGAVNDHCDSRYNAAIASTPKGATTKAPQIIEEKQKESETYDIDGDDKDIEGPKKKRGRPCTAMGTLNDYYATQQNVATASTTKGAITKAQQKTEEEQKRDRGEKGQTYYIDDDDKDIEAPKKKRGRQRTVMATVNDHCDSRYNVAIASTPKGATTKAPQIIEKKQKESETYDIDGDDEDNQAPKKRGRPHTVMGAVNDHCDSRYNVAIASTSKGATTKAPQIIEEKQKESETYDIDGDDEDNQAPKKRGRPHTVMGAVNDHCDLRYNVAIASTSKGATIKAQQIIEEKQKERKTYDIDDDDKDIEGPKKKRGRPHTVMGAVNDHCDSRYNVAIASTSKGATIKAQQIIEEKQKERKTYDIDDDDKDIEGPKKKRGRPCTAIGTLNDYYATRQNVATASTSKGAITKAQQITEEEQKRDRGERGQKYDIDDDDDIEAPKKKRVKPRAFVLPQAYDPNDSKWTLKYRKPGPGLVELMPHSGVYINAMRFFNCKMLAKDCNTLARMLLMEIFTASALSVCSLTGTRAKAFDSESADVRPGLDEHARMVLLTFVEEFGHENGWNMSTQAVIISIRNKIQQMRPKLLCYSKVYNLY